MISRKILFVDDDNEVLEVCMQALADDGHDTMGASSGQEAISRYSEFRPDIVFMDVKMPGMSGFDAFLAIQKRHKNARVVLISNYSIDKVKYEYAKKKSLAGLIRKPIKWTDIERMIKKHAK